MVNDGIGNTAHQKPVESFAPMGAEDDEVGFPFRGDVDDLFARIALHDNRLRFKLRRAELISNLLRHRFGSFSLFLPNASQIGFVAGKFTGNQDRGRFDHMQDTNL